MRGRLRPDYAPSGHDSGSISFMAPWQTPSISGHQQLAPSRPIPVAMPTSASVCLSNSRGRRCCQRWPQRGYPRSFPPPRGPAARRASDTAAATTPQAAAVRRVALVAERAPIDAAGNDDCGVARAIFPPYTRDTRLIPALLVYRKFKPPLAKVEGKADECCAASGRRSSPGLR
jgi:hypothetical protein